jgi:nucleoside-diphosphate-sugar epimerase
MKKVLLTGAGGFIGWHCVPRLLELGYEIHATTRSASPVQKAGVHWHSANVLRSDETSELLAQVRPSHLLHLAWVTKPGEYWTSPDNLLWVQASLHLIQSFASQGGRRAVVAGSCAEYDWRFGYLSEQLTPTNPATLYGTSKHALRLMIEALADRIALSTAWGRLFHLFGPREHPQRLVPSVVQSLLSGEPAHCSHGRQVRDLLYVEDAADALAALLESEVRGPVNIASGRAVVLKEVIDQIATRLGRGALVRYGAIEVSDQEPPFLVADVTRLGREVSWSPRFSLESGLERTISWWSKELVQR